MKKTYSGAFCLVDAQPEQIVDGHFVEDLDDELQAMIKRDYPKLRKSDFICNQHLLPYRLAKLDRMMAQDYKQNQKISIKLTRVLAQDNYKITDLNEVMSKNLTFGQRIADAVAHFGGSWPFIISFLVIMGIWITINSVPIFGIKFDAFPYILLNLFLSMVAAIQAPLIMMSQNRSGERDRLQSENDYHVNQKSEEEIRVLHAKVDHLIQHDVPNLLEIQKMQIQILSEIQNNLLDAKSDNEIKHD